MSKRIAELESQASILKSKVAELKKSLAAKENKNQNTALKNKELEARQEEKSMQIFELNKQIHSLERNSEHYINAIASRHEDEKRENNQFIQSLQTSLNKREKENSHLKSIHTELQLKIKELETKNESLEILCREKANENLNTADKLMKLNAQLQHLEGRYVSVCCHLEKLEILIETKDKVIEKLHLSYSSKEVLV